MNIVKIILDSLLEDHNSQSSLNYAASPLIKAETYNRVMSRICEHVEFEKSVFSNAYNKENMASRLSTLSAIVDWLKSPTATFINGHNDKEITVYDSDIILINHALPHLSFLNGIHTVNGLNVIRDKVYLSTCATITLDPRDGYLTALKRAVEDDMIDLNTSALIVRKEAYDLLGEEKENFILPIYVV